jgi:transposase
MQKKIIGVDVSKATLDYTIQPDGRVEQVENNKAGIKKFITWAKKQKPQLVLLEATGGYQTLLVDSLHEAAVPVKVMNPRQVRDFARSLNRLGKTDQLDARILVQFGLSRDLEPDEPKDKLLVRMSQILQRRNQIQILITAEKNHLENAAPEIVPGIHQIIALLSGQLKELDKMIRGIIASTPRFFEQDAIVQSVPGLGPVVSATLLAEFPELAQVGRKEAAAIAGVAPFNRDSGKFRGKRHISGGRGKVRTVLYCAMRPCLIHNPIVRGWFERFRSAGKPYKVAVIACIRKLLSVLRSMLINETRWDETRFSSIVP